MFTSSTSHTAAVLWALSLAVLTQGKWLPFPAPTPADQQPPALVAWSPKTTEAPRIRGRAPLPAVFARETSRPPSLCGYVNANEDNPVTCKDSRSSCLFNTIYHAVGCCPNRSAKPKDCAQYTSCVPRTETCDGNCAANDYILKCSELSAPNCYTYEWPLLYKNYGCDASSYWSTVEVTYKGEPTPSTTSRSTSSRTATTSGVTSTKVTTEVAGIPFGTNGNSTSSASTTSTSPAISSTIPPPGINIGAIAGGSVGGVAVIAAFVLGLVFLLRKRSRGNNSPPAPIEYSDGAPGSPLSPTPKYYSQYHDPALNELGPGAGTVQPGWPVQGEVVYEAHVTRQ